MISEKEYADAVELYLESEYFRLRAKERQAERERRQQQAERTEWRYVLGAAALMVASVVVLYWG